MKFSSSIIILAVLIAFPLLLKSEDINSDNIYLSDKTIKVNESLEEYKKRINKKDEIKTLNTIKVIASKERETYNGQYIITQDIIQKSGAVSVADLLQQQPSIYIESNGEFGQSKTIKLNGSPSQHVVILLDGMKLDDPSNAQPFFDIGQIPLHFVEEIEIIKGPSSVLYGSGAIAGIINIKTKKYKENQTFIKQEIGSLNTLVTQAGANVNIGNFNLTLFGNFYKTDGYSLASTNLSGETPKNDASQVKDINLKLNYNFSENAYIDSFFKLGSTDADYDGFEIIPVDADNHLSKRENFYYFSYNFKLFSSFQNQLKFSQYSTKKEYEEISSTGIKNNYFYRSKEQFFGYKASYETENILFIGGLDFETKKMNLEDKEDKVTNDLSFYGNAKEEITDQISLEQGFRLDQNQRNISSKETAFSNNTAYSFGFSYDIEEDTFIKLNYGKSYRLPSLFELFGNYGNAKLKSETSQGINLEFSSGNFASYIQQFSINLFYNNVSNMIYFANNKYSNIGNYRNIGFDVVFPFYIANFLYINDLKILPTYTFINSKNKKNSYTPIPTHKFNTNFDIDITSKYHLSWNVLWVSSTTVINDNKEQKLYSYLVNNIIISAKIKESSKLYFRIDNIFNEQYQTTYGYNTKDRSYYFGIIVEM